MFVSITAFCYVKAIVYAPKEPKPYYQNGIFHDPPLSTYEDYRKALETLQPYRVFLENAWIGFAVLGVAWIILGITWLKIKR
jgi:hypothetical protein